jgi:MFS family permease
MTDRYARLLRVPHVLPLLAATLVARMPVGIEGLAIILFLRAETGSYAVAGAVAGAFALGSAIGAPVQSRMVDRLGQRPVLVPASAMHAAGVAGLLALGYASAPLAALLAVGVVGGSALPPMSSVLRSLWPRVLEDDEALRPTAFALDSIMVEMIFIAGPLLTAALVALVSPAAALGVAAAASLAGTLTFTSLEPSRAWTGDAHEHDHGLIGALASPGVRTLALTMLPLGACLGTIEVALPAFSDDTLGTAELAGVLLATWSFGSAIGGFVYGARERTRLLGLFLRFAALLPLALLPLAAAPSFAVMLLLLVPAGMAIAPLLASGNQMVGDVAPPGAVTEAYTWPLTALIAGVAAGSTLAGALVEAADWRAAMLAGAASGLAGAAVAWSRRGTLECGRLTTTV